MTDNVSEALRASCMRARVFTKAFGLNVTVKDASREVEKDAGAVRNSARVLVNKFAGVEKLHKNVRDAQLFCTDALKDVSMPYAGEDGWRLLPTANFMADGPGTLRVRLSEGNKMFKEALEALEKQADAMLAQARSNLGSFDVRLPSKDELLGAYSMRTAFEELPSGTIPGLPEAARQSLQRRADRALEACAVQAREHVLRSFVKPLESLVDAVKRIEEYDEAKANWKEGDPKPTIARFSDSTVTNIQDLHKNLDSLNVLNDPEISKLSEMVSALVKRSPQDLRDSEALRQLAGRRAQGVLDNLNDWLAPQKGAPIDV